MPFARMQEAVALATSIDTAMNRRDGVGMEMLRDLLPELREIIDDVNAALQEVDELLFTGLRDEAIALNDPEFARLAARLNLEDREAWPEVKAFFDQEGIASPPRIDFETLAALESAHAELEELGRPLDRLRRLVLERSPLLTRLAVLRRLRDADGTKPVWAETIADHERARVAELPELTKKALAAREPAAIAALHAELVDPEWSVPVPKDLVKATRGADLWARMRETVPVAERAAAALEAGLAAAESGLDPAAVAALRQARHQWYEAAGAVTECLAGLGECPHVAAAARGEGLDGRFAALGPRTQPALAWLEQEDAREMAVARRAQSLAQLESLLAQLPASAGQEAQWLAGVTHLERELTGQGAMPEDVAGRLAAAVAAIRRRPGRRLLVKAAIGAGVAVALIGLVASVRGCAVASSARAAAIATLRGILDEAAARDHDEVPARVREIVEQYPQDAAVTKIAQDIERGVELERERRSAVRAALEDHGRQLALARGDLEPRKSAAEALQPWPESMAAAAAAWRQARNRGGNPERWGAAEQKPERIGVRAAKVFEMEEESIDRARKDLEGVERQYYLAMRGEFRTRRDAIRKEIQGATTADARGEIRRRIEDLRAEVEAAKPANAVSDAAKITLPKQDRDELDGLEKQLAEARPAPPVEPGPSAAPDAEKAP